MVAGSNPHDALPCPRAGAFALLLLALTSVHHAYGAIAYHTPWRLHVALTAIPLGAAIPLMLRSSSERRKRAAALLILIVPVALIGVFEGGYNHLLKNIVYFSAGAEEMRRFFPPPAYELPGDLFFELTGIAQLVLAPFAAAGAVKILRRPSPAAAEGPIDRDLER